MFIDEKRINEIMEDKLNDDYAVRKKVTEYVLMEYLKQNELHVYVPAENRIADRPMFKPYRYFNMDELNNLVLKLRWWQKIILWFKPAYIGVDIGSGDKAYYTIIKKLGDKTIVLKTGEAKIEFGIDKAV